MAFAPSILGPLGGWEEYKRRLPRSITEGPTTFDLLTQPREELMDTRIVREEPGEESKLDRSVRTAQDMMAIQQGLPPRTMMERGVLEEPSTYEKIMSPIADISSILQRGKLASREAGLKRSKIELDERRLNMEQFGQSFDAIQTLNGRIRSLPIEQQDDAYEAYAQFYENAMPGVDGSAVASILRFERDNAGTIGEGVEELMELMPGFAAVYPENPEKAMELVDTAFLEEYRDRRDAKSIPTIREWLDRGYNWIRENKPEMLEEIDADGMRTWEEFQRVNKALPEGQNGVQLPEEFLHIMWRNRNAFPGYISPEVETEAYLKKRATLRAEREVGKGETGVNVLIPGLEEGVAFSPRISYDGGRTFWERGEQKNVSDYPGAQVVGTRIEAGGVSDLAARLETKRAGEAGELAAEYAGKLATGEELLRKMTRAGWRAVGVPGWTAEHIGGIIGSVNPPAGRTFTEWISGVSPDEIAGLRVAARSFAAQTIPAVTAEEGARKSDFELRLSTQVSKVADPTTDFSQMRGAIGGVIGVWLANHERALIEAGEQLQYDLDTEYGRLTQLGELIDMGFSDQQAVDTLKLLEKQRKWLVRGGLTLNLGEPGG